MAFVYLLISETPKKKLSYVGWTMNLAKRLKLHNSGNGAKFTKGRKWKLVYYEYFSNKNEAMKREYHLKKNYKLRKEIKEIYTRSKYSEK